MKTVEKRGKWRKESNERSLPSRRWIGEDRGHRDCFFLTVITEREREREEGPRLQRDEAVVSLLFIGARQVDWLWHLG